MIAMRLGMAYVSLFDPENNWSILVTIPGVTLVRSSSAMYPIVAMRSWQPLISGLSPFHMVPIPYGRSYPARLLGILWK